MLQTKMGINITWRRIIRGTTCHQTFWDAFMIWKPWLPNPLERPVEISDTWKNKGLIACYISSRKENYCVQRGGEVVNLLIRSFLVCTTRSA